MNNSTPSPIAPRPELSGFQPYKPGLSLDQIKRQHGLKSVIKLASNENTLGPSPRALQAYKHIKKELYRYPESRSVDLRARLAERHRVDLGEVIIGAGSDEIIELLAKTYLSASDHIVVSESAFMQYRLAAQLMGASVTAVALNNMKHDLAAMAASTTSRTKMVFIANPNNPTGTYNTRREVNEFLSALSPRVLPVFDEAYFEYATDCDDYPSMIAEFFRKRPMVILRTFSKIYGLAGLRIGYGVAPEACVAEMDKIRPPFNVSKPAQAAALAALDDIAHIKKSVAMVKKQKEVLASALGKMGFAVIPSAANFILFKVAPFKGRRVFDDLLSEGVIVRSVDEYGLPDHVRVTVGSQSENKRFLTALARVTEATYSSRSKPT